MPENDIQPTSLSISSFIRLSRMNPTQQAWLVVLLLMISMILALVLRLHGLDKQSFWIDEAASLYFAKLSWTDLWGERSVLETNPPLYYSLLKLMLVFGNSETTVRMLSVVLGVLTIPVVYVIGRVLMGPGTGLVGACLLATSYQHIKYCQDARAYPLLMLASSLAILATCRLLMNPAQANCPLWKWGGLNKNSKHSNTIKPMWGMWVLYGLSVITSLYTHNTAVLVPVVLSTCAVVVTLARRPFKWNFAWNWTIVNMLTLAAYAWWLPVVVQQQNQGLQDFWILGLSWTRISEVLYELFGNFYFFSGKPWFDYLLWCLAIIGMFSLRSRFSSWVVLLFVAVGPVTLATLLSLRTPILIDRILIWCLIGYYLLLARGLTLWHRPWIFLPLVMLVLAGQIKSSLNFVDMASKEPWRQMANHIISRIQPGDSIIYVPATSAMAYRIYHPATNHQQWAIVQDQMEPHWYVPDIPTTSPTPLLQTLDQQQRLWVIVRRGGTRSSNTLCETTLTTLTGEWTKAEHIKWSNLETFLYLRETN
ncbi:MAG: hypothetical protein HC898_09380 [Phycisphaerales bacterium]|nr:hypothetical protein [Phycisphaerales bacterium]